MTPADLDQIDGDLGSCHLCGMDPIEHERVPIGVTEVDLCAECNEELRARLTTEAR